MIFLLSRTIPRLTKLSRMPAKRQNEPAQMTQPHGNSQIVATYSFATNLPLPAKLKFPEPAITQKNSNFLRPLAL
jgi:hypothetical protein